VGALIVYCIETDVGSLLLTHICINVSPANLFGDSLVLENQTEPNSVMGPVDYLIVGFPENKFSGKIAPELAALQNKGLIRVIDLVFVYKDANGKVFTTEAKDLQGEAGLAYSAFAKNTKEWFYEGDINALATALPNNSSAALLLYENVWAIGFKKALLEAGAELIDMGRIPPDAIAKEQELMARGGS
jgi:hypothetical protein